MLIEHNSVRNLGYINIQRQEENGHRGDSNTIRIIDSTLISNVFIIWRPFFLKRIVKFELKLWSYFKSVVVFKSTSRLGILNL